MLPDRSLRLFLASEGDNFYRCEQADREQRLQGWAGLTPFPIAPLPGNIALLRQSSSDAWLGWPGGACLEQPNRLPSVDTARAERPACRVRAAWRRASLLPEPALFPVPVANI